MKKINDFLIARYRNGKTSMAVITGIFICLLAVLVLNLLNMVDQVWTPWFDVFITLFTAFMAVILSIQAYSRKLYDNLEKRLTVHFILKDKCVMSCYEAFLTGESDIRNWGQQIGQQMNNGQLSFYPYMYQEAPQVKRAGAQLYKLYVLTVYLKFDHNDNYIPMPKETGPGFNPAKYKVWYDNNPNIPGNAQKEFDNKDIKKPYTLEELLTRIDEEKNNTQP